MSADLRSTANVVDALDRLFDARKRKREEPAADGAHAHVLAAAVLHLFEPRSLQPFNDDAGPPSTAGRKPDPCQVYSQLFACSTQAVGWRHATMRTLKQEARTSALRELGNREIMRRALAVNPQRQRTAVQCLIDAWLNGPPLDLETMPYAELECLGQLYEWGMDSYGGLPERQRFEAHRARRSAFAVFEHLVDKHFIGREAELQMLRDHVGVVSPSVWSRVRAFLSSGARPPLVIWGPGGTGKTALIGRFLLEHINSHGRGWFPFVYLPFDSKTIDVDDPFTVLVDAAAQLYRQIAQADGTDADTSRAVSQKAFAAFQAEVALFRDRKAAVAARAYAATAPGARGSDSNTADLDLYAAFAVLLTSVASAAGAQQNASAMPVVLVFDTFEEVQYRSRQELSGLWQMLDAVQRGFPSLRVVIAGRGRPAPFLVGKTKPTVYELSDLAEQDAVELLRHLGLADTELAVAIVSQVGSNPLTLRLAARVAVDEPPSLNGLKGIQSRRFGILRLAPELVRGQLYRRVLDHIHDPAVRELAHPGMVLRRVTPEIIEQVLAPVCGLQNVDATRAEQLFDELRQEHSLVRLDDDNSLRYREEVRQPMIELMMNDKPAQVRRIHHDIMAYYQGREPLVVERAEEIYHALMLCRDEGAIDVRWMEGVERYLAPAINEFGPAQRIWLASHMSIELPPEVYAQASIQQWEQIYGRKVADASRHEGPEAALVLLGERAERTPQSPLFAFEARALMALDRAGDAAGLIDRALLSYPPLGNQGRLAELTWLRAQAAQWLQQRGEALDILRRLVPLAESLRSPLPLVQTLAEIMAPGMPLSQDEQVAFRRQLAAALDRLDEPHIDAEQALIRLVLVRLAPDYGAKLGWLAPLVMGDFGHALRHGLIDVSRVLDDFIAQVRSMQIPISVPEPLPPGPPTWLATAAEHLATMLRGPAPDPMAAQALRTLMQAEQVTLMSATLAGLDEYREPWELTIHAEVSA